MATENPTALDDEAATAALIEQIRGARERLLSARFQGRDPTVAGPSGKSTGAVLARLVAADREGALVRAGGQTLNLAEDRAEEALAAAIGALVGWSFDTVNRELATAARLARDRTRQQRVSAIRALTNVFRALVFTAPGERLRGEPQALTRLLPTLDRFDGAERAHYRAEAERLLAEWRSAERDARLWRRWALLRARLAQRVGADESAIAWALRAWDWEQPSPFLPDEPLSALVDAARGIFTPLVAPESVAEEREPVRARDVVLAVSVAILEHDGVDTREPFVFVPYHPPSGGEGEE